MIVVIRIILLFILVSVSSTLLINYFHVEFGVTNFWQNHGFFFLIFISIFPRLTLLFSSVPFGGILWWLGWLFAPRLLVSILATIAYWNSNPILVIFSWLITLSGETSEKYVMIHNRRKKYPNQRGAIRVKVKS